MKIKSITAFLVLITYLVSGQDKFTPTLEIGISDIRYDERVGMIISYKHFNIHGQLDLKYRGFRLWILKTRNIQWNPSLATYAMAGAGKKIELGNAFIDLELAFLMLQDKEFWNYRTKASYIPNARLGYKLSDNNSISVWYNRFYNRVGYGNGWDGSLSYIHRNDNLKVTFTTWYNSGIILTEPGFNAGLAIELKRQLSWVEIRPEVVGLINITRREMPDAPRYGTNAIGTADAIVFRINFLFGNRNS